MAYSGIMPTSEEKSYLLSDNNTGEIQNENIIQREIQ